MTLVRFMLISFAIAAVAPRPALAQAAQSFEISAGYAWMNDTTDTRPLPLGWDVGVATSLTRWLSIAADAGGQYETVAVVGGQIELRSYALLAGPRVSARLGPFVEFAQLVAGVSHASGTAFGSTDTVARLAWQPGGGIDLPIASKVGARLELDERFVAGNNSPGVRETRVVAGIVLTWRRQ